MQTQPYASPQIMTGDLKLLDSQSLLDPIVMSCPVDSVSCLTLDSMP